MTTKNLGAMPRVHIIAAPRQPSCSISSINLGYRVRTVTRSVQLFKLNKVLVSARLLGPSTSAFTGATSANKPPEPFESPIWVTSQPLHAAGALLPEIGAVPPQIAPALQVATAVASGAWVGATVGCASTVFVG